MEKFKKIWEKSNIYDFTIEFNRIENYNEYCREWIKYFLNRDVIIESKTNWLKTDIPDLNDYNRIKGNINALLKELDNLNDKTVLNISNNINQSFDFEKANAIENALFENYKTLTDYQFTHNICGLTTCGNDLKLNLG